MSKDKSNAAVPTEGGSEKFLDLTQDQIIEIKLAKKQITNGHTLPLKEVDDRVKLWLN